jgi:hypothetical protein
MLKRFLAIVAVLLLAAPPAMADKITLQSGRVVEGQILQENASNFTVRLDHGVMTIPASMVREVDKTPPPALAKPAVPSSLSPAARATPAQHIPAWDALTTALATQRWATNLMQIPATVIDKGQMRAVPYTSYRCGEDYEVNVYGDPDAPAAVEIGVYRSLLKSEAAKSNCIEFIASVLGDHSAAEILRKLNGSKDLVVHNGLSIEITPETDEDAYGGWWVSVYDEKTLDAARATPKELEQITVARSSGGQKRTPGSAPTTQPQGDPLYDWQQDDLRRSRPPASGQVGGGSVYVRGYQRRDGTYVHSYTRSAPGSGGGRHR